MKPRVRGNAAAGRGKLLGRSRIAMTDIHTKKPGKAGTTPNFEMPKFDMPKIEMPEAFRDMAEKGVQQAKDAYARIKSAAEEATDLAEDTYATATKGAAE